MRAGYIRDLRTGAMLGGITGLVGTVLVPIVTGALTLAGLFVHELLYLAIVGSSFGLGLGIVLHLKLGMAIWKVALLIFLTPLFYYCGLSAAIYAHDLFQTGGSFIVSGLAGGALGAGLVVFSLKLLMPETRGGLDLIGRVAVIGAIIGAAALPLVGVKSELLGMFILHVPWHMGVMAVVFAELSARFQP